MNEYLLSDNNDISIKVVVFEGTNKSVMPKRTEYGSKCLLISASEVMGLHPLFSCLMTGLK